MPRWSPNGIERLQEAALDLFDERGFEQTTVAAISQRAGLTQRSFYNHFSDKREVLFLLAAEYQRAVVDAIAEPAADLPPLDLVMTSLRTAADSLFEGRRKAILRRHAVLVANPELQERELAKQASLTSAVVEALRARGIDPEAAARAAGIGMLVQQAAFAQWNRPDTTRTLGLLLDEALDDLAAELTQRPAAAP